MSSVAYSNLRQPAAPSVRVDNNGYIQAVHPQCYDQSDELFATVGDDGKTSASGPLYAMEEATASDGYQPHKISSTVGLTLLVLMRSVIAIFAFATTTSVHSASEFSVQCPGQEEPTITTAIHFRYPFKLHSSQFTVPICNSSMEPYSVGPKGDFSQPAQFYVFIGVIAFLYSVAVTIVYVCLDEKYHKYDQVAIIDFCVTSSFTLLWLLASCLWTRGVGKMKAAIRPNALWHSGENGVFECEEHYASDVLCQVTERGNFASLHVSIIFGFLNVVVWAGNLYFLYKETKWYKKRRSRPDLLPDPLTNFQDPAQ